MDFYICLIDIYLDVILRSTDNYFLNLYFLSFMFIKFVASYFLLNLNHMLMENLYAQLTDSMSEQIYMMMKLTIKTFQLNFEVLPKAKVGCQILHIYNGCFDIQGTFILHFPVKRCSCCRILESPEIKGCFNYNLYLTAVSVQEQNHWKR